MRAKSQYYLDVKSTLGGPGFAEIAGHVYNRVFRTELSRPGFMLLNLPAVTDSFQLRQFMVALKQTLHEIHRRQTGNNLVYTSMGRFDQQDTTKPHRDGGPDQSLLMLGYEPTPVRSRLFIADYTYRAQDMDITPKQFLEDNNPMYADGERMLTDYTTQLEGCDLANYQILVINNSCLPFREDRQGLLGVLHQAVIENPTADATRIVNSTMIASVGAGLGEPITAEDQERFLTTERVSKSAYD